jgi:hypothetical protein
MMSMTSRFFACLTVSLCMMGCAGDDGEEDVETQTEGLRPTSNACVSTEDCPYGHCTTEDGICDQARGCTPGYPCATVCYGECVASPSP